MAEEIQEGVGLRNGALEVENGKPPNASINGRQYEVHHGMGAGESVVDGNGEGEGAGEGEGESESMHECKGLRVRSVVYEQTPRFVPLGGGGGLGGGPPRGAGAGPRGPAAGECASDEEAALLPLAS